MEALNELIEIVMSFPIDKEIKRLTIRLLRLAYALGKFDLKKHSKKN